MRRLRGAATWCSGTPGIGASTVRHPRGLQRFAFCLAVLLFALAGLMGLGASPARAQIGSARYSSVVMDAATGNVVSAIGPDEPRFPASLTKMMTLYLTFEALRDRRVTLDELVPVSPHAASMEPSKLGLLPGSRLTVSDAVLALVTKSANDAASALGELLGGSEDEFAQMMTLRARSLGMTRTVFRNASGLPDVQQTTTARDLALLARHLVLDFPDEYHYFSVPSFVFRGRVIPNHDRMLQTYPGADGIKTGYIVASGFNLVTSAKRGDVRLIGVVLGAARSGERDQNMAALLDAGFTALGVPVSPARPALMASRFGLVASAQAATLPLTDAAMSTMVTHVASRRLAYAGARHPSYAAPRHAAYVQSLARAHSRTVSLHGAHGAPIVPATMGRHPAAHHAGHAVSG